MSKGIAVEFLKRFANVENLKQQHVSVGGVASLHLTANKQKKLAIRSHTKDAQDQVFEDRIVYYMVTKEFYYNKPTLESFTLSLIALRDMAIKHEVKTISMPRIGCGLDKLNWYIVKELIRKTFDKTCIKINVYYL